jgi:hypothetical protein
MKKIIAIAFGILLAPAIASANVNVELGGVKNLVADAVGVLNIVIGLMITLAVIVFIWGLIKFIFNTSPDGKGTARNYMIYSVIAFAVMTGLWALSNFLLDFFGLNDGNQNITLPTINVDPLTN